MKQKDLNAEMRRRGAEKSAARLSKLMQFRLRSLSPSGKAMLQRAVELMIPAIRHWREAAKDQAVQYAKAVDMISGLPNEVLAAITCRTIINHVDSPVTVTTLSGIIGKSIAEEQGLRDAKLRSRSKNKSWSLLLKQIHARKGRNKRSKFLRRALKIYDTRIRLRGADRYAVGVALFDIFVRYTGIVKVEYQTSVMGARIPIAVISPSALAWLSKADSLAACWTQDRLPMVDEPVPWEGLVGGGYPNLETAIRRPLVIHIGSSPRTKRILEKRGMAKIYSAINAVQRTPLRINQWIVDLQEQVRKKGIVVNDWPSQPLPPKPEGKNPPKHDKEGWKTRRRELAIWYQKTQQILTTSAGHVAALKSAVKFGNSRIYMPQQLDSRGRMYPMPSVLNPQGPDWMRSMFMFAREEKLTEDGLFWLGVYGANCMGYDKVSFDDRVARMLEIEKEIIFPCAEDPLRVIDHWRGLDKPWQFLAFCRAWSASRLHGHPVSQPCWVDGSNNGLQLLSILMRDPRGCEVTNCVPKDAPSSAYQAACSDLQSILFDQRKTDKIAAAVLEVGIDKGLMKRPMMTKFYGATPISQRAYIFDWLTERASKDASVWEKIGGITQAWKVATRLIQPVNQAIYNVVPGATSLLKYLQEVSNLCLDAGVEPEWPTPDGFFVGPTYRQTDGLTIKCFMESHAIRCMNLKFDNANPSARKHGLAITANFIHSLDKNILVETINTAQKRGVEDFIPVHDSYGQHPNYMGIVKETLPEAVYKTFDADPLGMLVRHLENRSKKSLPQTPDLGSFNLSDVRDADYMYH